MKGVDHQQAWTRWPEPMMVLHRAPGCRRWQVIAVALHPPRRRQEIRKQGAGGAAVRTQVWQAHACATMLKALQARRRLGVVPPLLGWFAHLPLTRRWAAPRARRRRARVRAPGLPKEARARQVQAPRRSLLLGHPLQNQLRSHGRLRGIALPRAPAEEGAALPQGVALCARPRRRSP